MFIKTVLRARALPFIVADNTAEEQNNRVMMAKMKDAIRSMREQSVANDNEGMSMDEIDAEIAAYRRERRSENA